MHVQDASFITSAVRPSHYPPAGPPELAFAGRSNVGKSSLINAIVNRKKLVRTSSRPGCTQQINFFSINQDQLRLVDLPGYGFAKVPLAVKASWQKMIENYLLQRPTLKGVVVITDVRREPTNEDWQLMNWLKAHQLNFLPILTKADKLSRNQSKQQLLKLKPKFAELGQEPVLFSAETGQGKSEIWSCLLTWCADGQPQPPAGL